MLEAQTQPRGNALSELFMDPDSSDTIHEHWQNLAVMLECAPLSSVLILKQPPSVPVPSLSFIHHLFQLCRSLQEKELLERHILAGILLFKEYSDTAQLNSMQLQYFNQMFPHNSLEEIISASWIAVPLATVRNGTAIRVSVLLGIRPGNGRVITQNLPEMDDNSRNSLKLAVPADKDLFAWSLQHQSDGKLTGRSLGLPAAIAINLLQNGRQWPQNLLASGELDADGHVKPVKHIQQKKMLLPGKNGLFLIPVENRGQESSQNLLSVNSIDEAARVVNYLFHGTDNPIEIKLMQLAAEDPAILLSQFHKLPPEFFVLNNLDSLFKTVRQSPLQFIDKLCLCLENNNSRAQLPKEVSNLFSLEEIWKLARQEPFAALEYSLAQLTFQNHHGRTENSRRWSELAKKIAKNYDARKELSSYANLEFVNTRFNRYDFRPELPESFSRRLEHEKKIHALNEDDSRQLGAMYGTLTQNFGFCGPAYLTELQKTADKAFSAFGRRGAAEHSRIGSYVVYGLLDSEKFADANRLFGKNYKLPVDSPDYWIREILSEGDQQRSSCPFLITLLCRLLAEQPNLARRCAWDDSRKKLARRTVKEQHHPWQLTAVNLARCCLFHKENDIAIQLLNHAAGVCMKHGATMCAMTLLPLATLYEHNLLDTSHITLAEKITTGIRNNTNLNQSHFSDLLQCNGGEEILMTVNKKKNEFFPFSYR